MAACFHIRPSSIASIAAVRTLKYSPPISRFRHDTTGALAAGSCDYNNNSSTRGMRFPYCESAVDYGERTNGRNIKTANESIIIDSLEKTQ